MNCSVCGNRTWNEYCSNACKQKAYRVRKKQKDIAMKKAKEDTMTFNEHMCYERMAENYETFASNFRDFKDDHGLKVAIDMMYTLANILDNYDPDGDE